MQLMNTSLSRQKRGQQIRDK